MQITGSNPGQTGEGVPNAPPDRQPPNLKLAPVRTKAGYAVVGLGELSVQEILPAFSVADRSRPAALVSGHRAKAAELLATRYGVNHAAVLDYEQFDRLRDLEDWRQTRGERRWILARVAAHRWPPRSADSCQGAESESRQPFAEEG